MIIISSSLTSIKFFESCFLRKTSFLSRMRAATGARHFEVAARKP